MFGPRLIIDSVGDGKRGPLSALTNICAARSTRSLASKSKY